MRTNSLSRLALAACAALATVALPATRSQARPTAQAAAITYQGLLKQSNEPINGNVDLQFKLFDAAVAGNPIGVTLVSAPVAVSNGTFTVSLDFGALAFNGEERWLDIGVSAPNNGLGPFTPLTPRQRLATVPYASYALNNGSPFASVAGNAILSSGNVGIGTGAPLGKLHVAGGQLVLDNNQALRMQSSTGSQAGLMMMKPDESLQLSNLAAGSIVLGTSSNVGESIQRLSIAPSGTVGIGAGPFGAGAELGIGKDSTPSVVFGGATIEVGDDFASQLILATSDTRFMELVASQGAASSIQAITPFGVDVRTGATLVTTATRMHIAPTGEIGIGTPSPQAPLHIVEGFTGVAPHANASLAIERDANNYLSILAPDANETGVLFGKPTGGSTSGGIVYNASTSLDGFQFRTGGNNTRAVIDATGNVGIGTTLPTEKLHVNGNLRVDGSVSIAPVTRRYSISGAECVPQVDSQTFFKSGYVRGNTATAASNFIAPIHLPDGATIIELNAQVLNVAGGTSIGVTLNRMATNGSTAMLANASTSTASAGVQTITDATIAAPASVDNDNASYYIQFSWITPATVTDMRAYRAEIVYTIATPLP